MARKRNDDRSGALDGLRRAERELTAHLASLREVIRSLESGGARGASRVGAATPARKRNMSAKGRAAIARAARKRWAAYRAAKRKRS